MQKRVLFSYLGSKSRLASWICDVATAELDSTVALNICEPFCGTAAVSREAAGRGWGVMPADVGAFACVAARAQFLATPEDAIEAERWAAELNSRHAAAAAAGGYAGGYVHHTFSPAGGRMFFTEANALSIDYYRSEISKTSEISSPVADVLVTALLLSCSRNANAIGQFRAFLKEWDPRAQRPMTLDVGALLGDHAERATVAGSMIGGWECVSRDAADSAVLAAPLADVLYLDPPYTCRSYAKFYHVLDTVAKGDAPEISVTSPVTGCRADAGTADGLWSSKRGQPQALRDLLARVAAVPNRRTRLVLMSYGEDTGALMTSATIQDIMRPFGEVKVHRRQHPRFNSGKNNGSGSAQVTELLFSLRLFHPN